MADAATAELLSIQRRAALGVNCGRLAWTREERRVHLLLQLYLCYGVMMWHSARGCSVRCAGGAWGVQRASRSNCVGCHSSCRCVTSLFVHENNKHLF